MKLFENIQDCMIEENSFNLLIFCRLNQNGLRLKIKNPNFRKKDRGSSSP